MSSGSLSSGGHSKLSKIGTMLQLLSRAAITSCKKEKYDLIRKKKEKEDKMDRKKLICRNSQRCEYWQKSTVHFINDGWGFVEKSFDLQKVQCLSLRLALKKKT